MKKIKVLVASHAGVLAVNRALFQELALAQEPGFEVKMIVPETWRGDLIEKLQFQPEESDRHITIFPMKRWMNHGALFFYLGSLRKKLGNWQPDFLFLDEEPWSLNAKQFYRAFPKAKKCFFTKQNILRKYPWPFSKIEQDIFRESIMAFSIADEVTQALRAKNFEKPIHYLPHSYDVNLFRRLDRQQKVKARRRLGLNHDSIVFGYFGRLTEEKGVRDFLVAARSLQANKNAQFLVVGNGSLQKEVARCAEEIESLLFHEAIAHDEVGQAMGCCDVVVVPSHTTETWKEQFGRVIMEANACGAAVLGTNSGEIPHLIQRTAGGLVFAEKNIEELVSNMNKLLQDRELLAELQEKGYRYANENLTHKAVSLNLAQCLNKFANY